MDLRAGQEGKVNRGCSRFGPTGFTLIEITFAIMILAASLVVLLGLQSASVERTVRDRNRQQAQLIARQILTAIETDREGIEEGEAEGTIEEVLKEFPAFKSLDLRETDALNRFQARVSVKYWEIPQLEKIAPKSIKRIEVNIYWGRSDYDTFSVVYFIPEEPNDDDTI